jgi:hypothetical protein
MSSDQGPRRSSALWRALCSVGRAMAHLHDEQIYAWEAWCQVNRAAVPEEGALAWVRTLDGYRLAGQHLPASSGAKTGETA